MTLQERRKNLLENTLLDVGNSMDEIMKIRLNERKLEFAFKLISSNENMIHLQMKSSGGSVNGGSLTITKQGQTQTYSILPFPILFLHQISLICSSLKQQIKCAAANYSLFSLETIDSLIAEANAAVSILSDPKFMNIEIQDYFDPPLEKNASLVISIKDGDVKLSASSICNVPGGVTENIEDSTLLRALDQILKRSIKSLKFLRCDILTWNLPDNEE